MSHKYYREVVVIKFVFDMNVMKSFAFSSQAFILLLLSHSHLNIMLEISMNIC